MVNRLLYKWNKGNPQTQHCFFSYRLLTTRVGHRFQYGLFLDIFALCKCRLLTLHKPFNAKREHILFRTFSRSLIAQIGKFAECAGDLSYVQIACAAVLVPLNNSSIVSFCCFTKISRLEPRLKFKVRGREIGRARQTFQSGLLHAGHRTHHDLQFAYIAIYQGAFHVKPTPKVRQALSYCTPGIFREREIAKTSPNRMILRNSSTGPNS